MSKHDDLEQLRAKLSATRSATDHSTPEEEAASSAAPRPPAETQPDGVATATLARATTAAPGTVDADVPANEGHPPPPTRHPAQEDSLSEYELIADADLFADEPSQPASDETAATRPTAPADDAPPSIDEPPDPSPASAPVRADQATGARAVALDWQAECAFYRREAEARAAGQPESGGLMWLHATDAAKRASEDVSPALQAALDLSADSLPLLRILRMTLLRLGRRDEALELTRRQLHLGGDNQQRSAALIEAAALLQHCQRDGTRALGLLEQALDLQPHNPIVLALAAGLRLELGHDRSAAETLEQLAEIISTPEDRAICLYAAGTVREGRLKQSDLAQRDYLRATEHDPENLPALLALADLQQATGEWHELADTLEHLARIDFDPADKARYLLRAAALRFDRDGNTEAATRNLSEAAELIPEDPVPLSRLAQAYERNGRHGELVGALRQLLRLTPDGRGQAALLTRIGWLLQHRTGEAEGAIGAYREALAARPGYVPALHALDTLYRQQDDVDSLVDLLRLEAEGSAAVEQRAFCCVEAADLLVEQLDRPDEARQLYRRALELSSGLSLAFWPLRRLLAQQERFGELADLLAAQVECTGESGARTQLLLELAHLQRGPLESAEQCIQTLRMARESETGDGRSSTIELVDLLHSEGRFAELVELLLEEANLINDANESRRCRLRAAVLLERRLGEYERALETYRAVLDDEPEHVGTKRAVARLYYRLGRWNDLIALTKRTLEGETDGATSADLWCSVGQIYEDNLGQPADAVTAYQQALQQDPASAIAVAALQRTIPTDSRGAELIDVLERYAANRREPVYAANALCRAAELAENDLDDPARAAELYQQATAQMPAFMPALYGLHAVQQREGNLAGAAATLRQLIEVEEGTPICAQLQLQLARTNELGLGEPPDRTLYETVAQSSSYGSRLRFEQLRTGRLLASEDLADILLQLGSQTPDSALAAAYLLESAYRYEAADAHARHLEAAQLAVDRQPDELPIVWCLDRALRQANEPAKIASLLERVADKESNAQLRLYLLADAAATQLEANQHNEAKRLANCCLSSDRQHLPSLRILAHVATCQQDWPAFAAAQDRLADACMSRENRQAACLAASDVWAQQLGNEAAALSSLQLALNDDPNQPEVFARCELLLRKANALGPLSELYAQRIENTQDTAQQIELLRLHARLLREELDDPARSAAELSKLLELAPHDVDALVQLSGLLEALNRWSDAAEALSALVRQCGHDPATQQRASVRLARIRFEKLHQAEPAQQVLRAILEREPAHIEARELLVHIAFADGRWDDARLLLETLAAENDTRVACWALLRLADVAHIGLRDASLRERYEREALTLAACDADALAALVDQFRTRGDPKRLVEHAEAVIRETPQAGVAIPLRLALAELMLTDLRQPERALEHLRDSMLTDPQHVAANLLFARALEQRGDTEAAMAAYRKLLEDDVTQVEAHRGLCGTATILGDPPTAAAAAAALDVLGAATAAEKAQLRSFESSGTPRGALNVSALYSDATLHPLAQLLDLIAPHLGSVYPLSLAQEITNTQPAGNAALQLGAALGLPGIKVAVQGNDPARAGVGHPVPLQVGLHLAGQAQSAAFRFWVGRALAGAVTAGALVEQLSDDQLQDLLEAVITSHPIDPTVQQLRKSVWRALPRKVRKQVEHMQRPRADTDTWSRLRETERYRADRAGLIMSGSPDIALQELARAEGTDDRAAITSRVQMLMRFAISEQCSSYHRGLWTNAG